MRKRSQTAFLLLECRCGFVKRCPAFPILARCCALMGAEGVDKVAGVLHADAVGDFGYRQVGCAQQLLCARQAQLRQIFAGRLAEIVLKAALEMVFADIIARRKHIERELLRVLLMQILPHLL